MNKKADNVPLNVGYGTAVSSSSPSENPSTSKPVTLMSLKLSPDTGSSSSKHQTIPKNALVFTNSNAKKPYSKPNQKKKGNKNRRPCAFCDKLSCTQPVRCALKLRFAERMRIHHEKSLCPDFMCIKSHRGSCNRPKITCGFCPGKHNRVFCQTLAIKDNLA